VERREEGSDLIWKVTTRSLVGGGGGGGGSE